MNRKHKIVLILIIVVASFLRLYKLSSVPTGFFADEAAIGYNAYTILKTGQDEYGKSFPIFFKSFGDFKHPIAIYSTVPAVKIMGLNEESVRITSVIYGIITVIFIFLIGKELGSATLGLWSALIAATLPWLIHYARTGFDCNSYVAFFTLSAYLLIRSGKQRNYIVPFFLSLALTFYTYQPAKLLVPIFLIVGLINYFRTYIKRKREVALGLTLFIIISIPMILSLKNGEGLARFNQVAVFSPNQTASQILKKIKINYLNQLTPTYFFIKGDPTFNSRHLTNGLTPLLLVFAPFVAIGLFKILKSIGNPDYRLLFFWLLIYPLGGTFVSDPPYSHRSIIGAPLFALIIGLGIYEITRVVGKIRPLLITFSTLLTVVILINTFSFFTFYINKYPLISSDFWGWQYGPKEIMRYFLSVRSQYDNLYMSGEFNGSEIFPKFYDPTNLCESKCKTGDFWREPSIYDPGKRQIFSLSPDYLNNSKLKSRFQLKKTIYYPNGSAAFLIGEVSREP